MTKTLLAKQQSFAETMRDKDNSTYWVSEESTLSDEQKTRLTKVIPAHVDHDAFFQASNELLSVEHSKKLLNKTNKGIKVVKQLNSARQNLLKSIDSIEELDSTATTKLSKALLHVKRDMLLEEKLDLKDDTSELIDTEEKLDLKDDTSELIDTEEKLDLKDDTSELIDTCNSLLLLIEAATLAMSTFKKNSRDNQHLVFYIQSLSVLWQKWIGNSGSSYKKGSKFYTFVVIMLEALDYPNSNPIALIEKAFPPIIISK
jgi:hypothetical protein